MFCGSCMHDNTLAAAMMKLGCDITLIPTYTPIRTDEANVSIDKIFYGGINVYLQEKSALFRQLPAFLDRWLDRPWLINWLASRGMETDARQLGALTLSMLRGENGHQRKEVHRLVDYLKRDLKPDLVNLSNILIGGSIPAIKRELGVPVVVTLQGDDLFLAELPPPYKEQAFAEIARIGKEVDAFITFSHYYADFMAGYLGLPREKFHIVPLGLNLADFADQTPHRPVNGTSTIGYLARICPAKGLHILVDAFLELRRRPGCENVNFRAAGWLGNGDKKYLDSQLKRLTSAGLSVGPTGDFHYEGVLDRQQKLEFLRKIHVFSVPTTYHDPKGIFVLEALASGVPVIQPAHGAFPELLAATGGGRLTTSQDPKHLADELHHLLCNDEHRIALAQQGHSTVHRDFTASKMAERTLEIYRQMVNPQFAPSQLPQHAKSSH